jgi:hypothetical protein
MITPRWSVVPGSIPGGGVGPVGPDTMSLGNDPSRVPLAEEPEPEECRYCHRSTYDPSGVCPDCHREGVRR